MKKDDVSVLVVILFLSLLLIGYFTQPSKSLRINVLWYPPFPDFMKSEKEYVPHVNDREQLSYRIYYVWDGQRQDMPWWIITNQLDGRWRVIETVNSDDYSTNPENNAIFNKYWITDGFSHVQRTRYEKFTHVVFGSELLKEEKAFRAVLKLIRVGEDFQKQGKDLYDAMSAYMKSHPELGTFWPPSRDYFDKGIDQIHNEYIKKQSELEVNSQPRNK